jgi:hypothetical protein
MEPVFVCADMPDFLEALPKEVSDAKGIVFLSLESRFEFGDYFAL